MGMTTMRYVRLAASLAVVVLAAVGLPLLSAVVPAHLLFAIGAGGFALVTALAPFVALYATLGSRDVQPPAAEPVGSSTTTTAGATVPYVPGPTS